MSRNPILWARILVPQPPPRYHSEHFEIFRFGIRLQANAEAIKEAQRGGIALARANDAKTKYRGRKPSFTRSQFSAVCNMLDLSKGVGEIAAETGLSRQTIYRIRDDRASAEAALTSWAA
jgi:putative DNA-invertase from lambdoid prophage Rac